MSRYRRPWGAVNERGGSVRAKVPGSTRWFTLPRGSTEDDALAWLAEQRLLERTGCRYEPSAMDAARLFEVWLEAVKAEGSVSDGTLNDYRKCAKRLLPLVGSVKIQALNRMHVERAREGLKTWDVGISTSTFDTQQVGCAKSGARTATGKLSPARSGSGFALAPKTVNNTLDVGRRCWKWALDHNLLRGPNPWSQVARLKVPKYEARWLSVDEARRFYAAALADDTAESRELLAGFLTFKRTYSEWGGIHWRDVDLPNRRATVRWILDANGGLRPAGSNKVKLHTIPLPDVLVPVLEHQQAYQREQCESLHSPFPNMEDETWTQPESAGMDPDGMLREVLSEADRLVFTRYDGQTFLPRTNLRAAMKRCVAAAGIDGHVRIHDTRHTGASLLLALGVPMKEVQELLAHSKMATTADIYAHADPTAVEASANKMGALLAGARAE